MDLGYDSRLSGTCSCTCIAHTLKVILVSDTCARRQPAIVFNNGLLLWVNLSDAIDVKALAQRTGRGWMCNRWWSWWSSSIHGYDEYSVCSLTSLTAAEHVRICGVRWFTPNINIESKLINTFNTAIAIFSTNLLATVIHVTNEIILGLLGAVHNPCHAFYYFQAP